MDPKIAGFQSNKLFIASTVDEKDFERYVKFTVKTPYIETEDFKEIKRHVQREEPGFPSKSDDSTTRCTYIVSRMKNAIGALPLSLGLRVKWEVRMYGN